VTTTLCRTDDGVLICKYGEVEDFPSTVMHEPDNARACVHLTGPMPRIFLVRRRPVEQLNFQPRIMSDRGRRPIIAARNYSTLTLSVDLIGPVSMTHPQRGRARRDHRVVNHWHFTLTEIEDDDEYAHRPRLLAVRKSSPASAPPYR
jgi:hypothetical protein